MGARYSQRAFAAAIIMIAISSGCVGEKTSSLQGGAQEAASPILFEWNWTVDASLETQQGFPVFNPTHFVVTVTPAGALPSWSVEVRSAENRSSYYNEACDPQAGCRVSQDASELPAGSHGVAVSATGQGTLHVLIRASAAAATSTTSQAPIFEEVTLRETGGLGTDRPRTQGNVKG